MTLDEAFDLFNRHGNVGRSPEDLRTNPPLRSQLDEAGRRVYQAIGDQKLTREAINLIWDHFYPTGMRYLRENGIVYAYDAESGVYGTAEYKGTDPDSLAAQDMLANPKPIPVADETFDWKKVCLHIINGVGDAEGVWFDSSWRLPSLTKLTIFKAYNDWEGPPKKEEEDDDPTG